jgi:hypothetical protein
VGKRDFDVSYGSGGLHIVFRMFGESIVTGLETYEVVYFRSDVSMLNFTGASLISNQDDFYSAFSPGVAAMDGRVYFSWREEECFGACAYDLPGQGVYMAEYDLASGVNLRHELIEEAAKDPAIAIAAGDIVVSWVRDLNPDPAVTDDVDEIYNYSDDTRHLLNLAQGGVGPRRLQKLVATDANRVMRSWTGANLSSEQEYLNHAFYDGSTDAISYVLQSRTDARPAFLTCPVDWSSDGEKFVVRGVFFDSTAFNHGGTFDFSADSGQTFTPAAQQQVEENHWCPKGAVSSAGELFVTHIARDRMADPERAVMRVAKHQELPPCQ